MLQRVRSSRSFLPRFAIGASLCAAALGAGLHADPAESAKPPLVRISVLPAIASVIPGQTLTLRAIGTYADDRTADITSKVSFEDDSPVAHIRKNILTARALGSVEIHAVSKSGGLISADNLSLTVSRIAELAISPSNDGVRLGNKNSWRALARLEDGTTRVNVTDFIEWSSSDPHVLKVGNAKRTKGLSAALRRGSATLEVADPDSGIRSSRVLSVVSDLVRVEATPSSRFLQLDDTAKCQAVGVFENEIEADISPDVRWASSDKRIATIDKLGATQPHRLGVAELIATDKRTRLGSNVTATNSKLTVVGELLSLRIDPATRDLAIGETKRLRVFGTFEGSSEAFSMGRRVDWFSSDAAIAVPEADGDVHCLAPGAATFSARDQKSGLTSTATGGDGVVHCL